MEVRDCDYCHKPNGWILLDPKYQACCGECEDNGDLSLDQDGILRESAKCRGCDRWGAVNCKDNTYYCGGSPSCCP